MKREIPLNPSLSQKQNDFILFCNKIGKYSSKNGADVDGLRNLRTEVIPRKEFSTEENKFFLAANVVIDLVAQGWKVHTGNGTVTISMPDLTDVKSTTAAKDFIRRGHLIERDEQLRNVQSSNL